MLSDVDVKDTITGTSLDRVPGYLAQFKYRFNRRLDLAGMIERFTHAGLRTSPVPYRCLKLAEVHG